MISAICMIAFLCILSWIDEKLEAWAECPPLPPYPDDGEDEGIYRPEDEPEQP